MPSLCGVRLGAYRLVSEIGAGGMGVVYAAHDERLDRRVAIKILKASGVEEGCGRFWREARAAAALNHPNICQIYDVGTEGDELFIVMELLEGEPLLKRMERGPLPPGQSIEITRGVLAGLEALHARFLIHRDIKPSNVFLTRHGVKLIDFGLARAINVPLSDGASPTRSVITQSGVLVGTPRYMSPEQLTGQSVDIRSDLFAVGAVLYELLSGRPAFDGPSPLEIYHSIVYDEPPALIGPEPFPALDSIIRRALAKSPVARYQSASAMNSELQRLLPRVNAILASGASQAARLMVLPFRLIRANPEFEFLGFSLADAITTSLSGLQSLLVRSSLTAARYANESDLRKIASEADVNFVLTGNLLTAGHRIRISTQLVEAATGTLTWSHATEGSLRDIFALQDEVVQHVVDSLPVSLTGREQEILRRDVPASPTAYEYYLRANQAACSFEQLTVARDLYVRSVEADPTYAPAWARLGRCYRVIAKFGHDPDDFALAEAAFRRALELNPDLALVHNLLGQLEADAGRAQDAAVRLVERAHTQGGDPELFAGLVHVCRFCGMLQASLAAHEHAHRLDPQVQTSITNTYLALGDYDRALATSRGVHHYIGPLSLVMLGRNDEAARLSREVDLATVRHPRARYAFAAVRAIADGDHGAALANTRDGLATIVNGPEELFYAARTFAFLGEHEEALAALARSVEQGFFCYPAVASDRWLDSVRARAGFSAVLENARQRHRSAASMFVAAGGDQLLGVNVLAAGT